MCTLISVVKCIMLCVKVFKTSLFSNSKAHLVNLWYDEYIVVQNFPSTIPIP